jgi:hypothetical protein
MQTPNTQAGRLTEQIMASVTQKLPKLPTHEYNRIYEAVLGVLSEQPEQTQAQSDAAEMANLLHLPLDCPKCGENSSFAIQYGCPQARPDCPYNPRKSSNK